MQARDEVVIRWCERLSHPRKLLHTHKRHVCENDKIQYARSPMYCGEIVSRSSEPTGMPMSVRSQSNWRASRRPLFILKVPSISGSLIRPFQPTVVRGFWDQGQEFSIYIFLLASESILHYGYEVSEMENLPNRDSQISAHYNKKVVPSRYFRFK
jgi:hypothetical protein